jgi:arylsulfatase A-like enzyme|tara:strand:- start:23370 stop:24734 length:1365 start_codon:yes stop_codon:yes gene_type:complete
VQKPNILLIVIDSLRSDKCFGAKKSSITPTIDNLIQNGAYFEQAISSAASTILSIGSLLTGLYPFRIGLGGPTYQKFDPKITNLVKILNDNGYTTYATAPEIADDFGLICDFQNPDSSYDNYFSLFSGLGDEILDKIKNKKLKDPWFFYIHLFDLHTPVIVPPHFNDKKYGTSQYERMVSAIDDWLSQMLGHIDTKNTIIILTADHGEYVPVLNTKNGLISLESSDTEKNLWKLGNKIPKNLFPVKRKMGSLIRSSRKKLKSSKINDENLSVYEKRVLFDSRMSTGHRMFDDLLRIPLILTGPKIPNNVLITNMIRQVDIFPTILNLISISIPNDIDGKNLLPLIEGKDTEELISYIESPPLVENPSRKYIGIRTSKYKFIQNIHDDKQSYELYNLQNDPLEEKNIITTSSKQIEQLKKSLRTIRNKKSLSQNVEYDDNEKRRIENVLKKLGYV